MFFRPLGVVRQISCQLLLIYNGLEIGYNQLYFSDNILIKAGFLQLLD
jgi:hypothetical protein